MIEIWQLFVLSLLILTIPVLLYIFQTTSINNMSYYKIKLITYIWLVVNNIKSRIKPLSVDNIGIEWKCTYEVNLNDAPQCEVKDV